MGYKKVGLRTSCFEIVKWKAFDYLSEKLRLTIFDFSCKRIKLFVTSKCLRAEQLLKYEYMLSSAFVFIETKFSSNSSYGVSCRRQWSGNCKGTCWFWVDRSRTLPGRISWLVQALVPRRTPACRGPWRRPRTHLLCCGLSHRL